MLLGNGDATFTSAVNFPVEENPFVIIATDLNNDGNIDLAVGNGTPGDVSVLVGIGDGTFQASQSFGAQGSPFGMAAGDFNGDGLPDILTALHNSDEISILINNSRPAQARTVRPKSR